MKLITLLVSLVFSNLLLAQSTITKDQLSHPAIEQEPRVVELLQIQTSEGKSYFLDRDENTEVLFFGENNKYHEQKLKRNNSLVIYCFGDVRDSFGGEKGSVAYTVVEKLDVCVDALGNIINLHETKEHIVQDWKLNKIIERVHLNNQEAKEVEDQEIGGKHYVNLEEKGDNSVRIVIE